MLTNALTDASKIQRCNIQSCGGRPKPTVVQSRHRQQAQADPEMMLPAPTDPDQIQIGHSKSSLI
jgi:hypothetical protein